ncbi:MAG: hypothetical protein JNN03_04525 [Rubrivivax sp.]|nr:hypothetical protein [Rubrivivax sp.]
MNTPTFKTRLPILALLLCGAFAAVPAWAAPTTDPAELAALAARHRQERADCMSVPQGEARTDCVRDTDVAYGHAKRHRASDIDPPFAKNVTLRCDALSGDENRDCLARMDGQGTTSGSVAEGGIYRELVVVETIAVPAPALPSAPEAASTPSTPTTVMPSAAMTSPMAPMTPVAPAASMAVPPPSATNPITPK